MSKSRARLLAELLNSAGRVKKDKSDLAGDDSIIDLDSLPTITNAKLENSSISIAGHSTALGGTVTLNTGDIGEHENYKYYTDARVDTRIVSAGSSNWNTAYGWGNHASAGYLGTNDNITVGTISSGNITATGTVIIDGEYGVSSSGMLQVRQSGDTDGDGIALTSGHARSHRIWKDANGVLNFGSSQNTDAFKQDLSGNVVIEGTVASGAISSSGTSVFNNFRLADTSKMGFGTVKAGGTVGHNTAYDEGIFWHTDNLYGIYRTSGTWASPNYQQLKLRWTAGIELDGGTAHGKSGVNIVNGSDLQMGGVTIIDSSRNITSRSIVATGTGTTATTYSAVFKNSTGTEALQVRDDGRVFIPAGYLYVSSTAGMYIEGAIRARGGISNDGNNPLSISSGTADITFNSKNFVSVGTISSGAITSSGSITASGNSNSFGETTISTLSVTGDLNITGNINSYNVTDLDVTDKTITVNSGNTQTLSDGAGLIVDRGTADDASILWNETTDQFDVSHGIKISRPAPYLTLKDTTDNDDHKIIFTNSTDGVEYEIATQNGTSNDSLTFYSASQEIVSRIGTTNIFEAHSNVVKSLKPLEVTGTVTWTGGSSTNANTAYGWGNHATQGYLTSIPYPVSGDWWNGGHSVVGTDGVMEVGKYIDFHTTDAGTSDYDVRITASSGSIAVSGTVTWTGGSSTNANTAYGWGDHASAGYLTAVPSKASPATALELGDVDLDDYAQADDAGFYHQLANSQADTEDNWPNGRAGSLLVQKGANLGGYGTTQLFIDYSASDVYVRSMYGSSAADTSWKRLYTTSDFVNNATTWDTAYGWGDHSVAGYPTIINSSYGGVYNIPIHASGDLYTTPTAGAVTITGSTGQISTPSHGNSSQWNTAYGWGDHASGGYSDEYKNYSVASGANHDTHHWNKTHAAYSNDGSSPNYIVLTTNVPQDNYSMGGFTLIFQNHYSGNDEGDVVNIYGYWNPESNSGFVGFRYHTSNPDCAPTIQVGRNSSGKTVFLISNESGSYAQVVAKDLYLGYSVNSANANFGDSWAFSEASSTTAFSNLNTLNRVGITAAQRTNWNTAYTYSQVGHLPLAGGVLTGALGIVATNNYEIDISGSAAGNIRANADLFLLSQTGSLNLGAGGSNSRLVINSSGNASFTGTISSGAITSSGVVNASTHFNVNGAGDLLKVNVSAWASNGNNDQAILRNGYNSTIGDHIVLKAAGNGTSHGAIIIADGVFSYGSTTSAGSTSASLTNPLSNSTAFTVTSGGNASFTGTISSGAITSTGTISSSRIQVGAYASSDASIIAQTGDIQLRIGSTSVEHNPYVRLQASNGTNNVYGDIQLDTTNQKLVFKDPGTSSGSIGQNPMRLDSSGNLEVSGNITCSNNITSGGYLQATSYLYTRNNLRVLNTAGDGWNTWATRVSGNYNLNVGTISSGAITSNSTFTVETVNTGAAKSTYGIAVFESTDAHIDVTSDSGGTWGSSILLRESHSSAFRNTWAISRKTGTTPDLVFNFGTASDHNINSTKFTFASDGDFTAGKLTNSTTSVAGSVKAYHTAADSVTLHGYGLDFDRVASYIRPVTDSTNYLYVGAADATKNWVDIRFRSDNGLQLNGSTFIDASRNLTNIGTITGNGKLKIIHAGTGTSNNESPIAAFSGQDQGGTINALSLVNSVSGANNNGVSISFHNASNWSPTGKITLQQEAAGTVTDSRMVFQTYNGGLNDALVLDHDQNAIVSGNLSATNIAASTAVIYSSTDAKLVLRESTSGTVPWNYMEFRNSADARNAYFGTNNGDQITIYGETGMALLYTNLNFEAAGTISAGIIDSTNVTTGTFRVYDGSTFRGGLGTGQWASGSSSQVGNWSLYAVNTLNFHSNNSDVPQVTQTSSGFNSTIPYQINGTTVIDASRNITAGTILARKAATDQTNSADSASMPSTTGAEVLRIEGGYADGRYTTEFSKIDRVGNLPLYVRQSKGTANSFSNIARFGDHNRSGGAEVFAVFGGARVTAAITADRLFLESTTDAAVNSVGHAFQIGPASQLNLIMDTNEIMARNNGSTSPLHINPDGGDVTFRNNQTGSTNLYMSGTAFMDASRNLTNIGTISASGIVSAEGVNSGGVYNYDSSGHLRVTHPGGAAYKTQTSNVGGAIKIVLPVTWTNTMMRMTIKVYEYTTGESFTIDCGGYNYASNGSWINTFAYITGQNGTDRNFTVRFGHDGTKCCIYIGELNSTWSYPQVSVTDWQGGYSGTTASSWRNGWDITFESSAFSSVNKTHTETDNNRYHGNISLRSNTSGDGVIIRNIDFLNLYSPGTSDDRAAIIRGITHGGSTSNRGGKLAFLTRQTSGGYNEMILDNTGNLTASGNVTAYSDERLKENIQTLDGSKVLQMRGVSFTKEGEPGSGVIAQELEKIAPELVLNGEYKSVAYGNLVGYLIENAKEQSAQINAQQKQINQLTKMVNALMEK